ncbi:hypothetical protein [Spirobacillus cienkowskii]|uniref:hypothetical protein n=1 Tax=Spirobacillus cienkowskii TaxID=495820 RepID=UPI0030D52C3A
MQKFKFYLATILLTSNLAFSDQIDGILVPQGKFDSKFPVVTMKLNKINPPVVRVTPSRPTVLIFPHQVTSCVSDNNAIIIEKGNPMKNATDNPGFSTVILKVDAVNLITIDSNIPEQTVINCQLVDANIYPIGIYFTDNNAYSVVKLLDNKQKQFIENLSFDMHDFQSIQISKNRIIKNEIKRNNYKDLEIKKIQELSAILNKNGFSPIKKENLYATKE